MKEVKIDERAERILGPVTIAQYIDDGAMREWPLTARPHAIRLWKKGVRYPLGTIPSPMRQRLDEASAP